MSNSPIDAGITPYTEREAALQGLSFRVLTAQRVQLGPHWRLKLRSPFWRLYVNNRHGASLTQGGRTISMSPGFLYLVPAWLLFETDFTDDCVQDYIHFEFCGFPPAHHQASFCRILSLPLTGPLRDLCRVWQAGLACQEADWFRFARSSALVNFAMAQGLQTMPDAARPFAWLEGIGRFQAALDLVAADPARPPGNEELARACGMSTGHFIKTFREALGTTPARYVLDRRIALSARLLATTRQSIEEIAETTGFSDRFHFSKVFRKRLQTAPATYRHEHRRTESGPGL